MKTVNKPAPAILKQQTTAPITSSSTAPVTEMKKSSGPENLFGARSKTLDPVTGPDGKAVATTASAAALWGQGAIASAKPPLAALTLKNLTRPQAEAKKTELEGKKAELETRISGRAGELDTRWNSMRLTDRTAILKSYASETTSLTDDTRTHLDGALKQSDHAQAQIETLHAQAQKLGPSHGAHPGTPEERKALAAQIWAARHQHQEAVSTATSTIDKAGLKIERLAMTEAAIDPSQGASSKYGSMSGLVGQLFETNFMLTTLDRLYFSPLLALNNELDREGKEAQKRQVIEDHWRERDDQMRAMIKDLSLKEVNGKRDLAKITDSGKTGDVGRMNANAVNKTRS